MRLDALSRLVRLSLARERKGAFFSAFGVAMGVGALVFFVGLGLGVGRVIKEKVFPTDARLVDVVPPAVSLGSLLGGGQLDAPTVERLRELPGVEAAYRKMNVRVPAVTRYDGVFFGTRLRMGMEVLALGVEPALVQGDVQLGEFKDAGRGSRFRRSCPRGSWSCTTRRSLRRASCPSSPPTCWWASVSRWSSTAPTWPRRPRRGPRSPGRRRWWGRRTGRCWPASPFRWMRPSASTARSAWTRRTTPVSRWWPRTRRRCPSSWTR
ncbi:ABC transporter permease [Myxococcus sp. MxC21-1]|nr:ABC transporter permease [Myxococcus sp. MxC21-1]